jgi:ketose-bisphosphate aldolase
MPKMLYDAQCDGYAVGYFEAWDQYSMEAVVEAAEQLSAPAILGVGGMFTDESWFNHLGLPTAGALGCTIAARAQVPVALLLNEVESFAQVVQGISYGFNTVMLRSSHLPFADNLEITRKVVDVAHAVGVSVEAELDELPDASAPHQASSLTEPDRAEAFVRATQVDALAVSVGNMHMKVDGEVQIDFALLTSIHKATRIPLVIHGGTGFPASAVPAAIASGVAKFNVGTILRKSFLEGIRSGLAAANPHDLPLQVIGSRLPSDILMWGKSAMKAEVAKRIQLYGSADKAT